MSGHCSSGKINNVIDEVKKMEMNNLEMSEIRWKASGKATTDNHTIIY